MKYCSLFPSLGAMRLFAFVCDIAALVIVMLMDLNDEDVTYSTLCYLNNRFTSRLTRIKFTSTTMAGVIYATEQRLLSEPQTQCPQQVVVSSIDWE